MMVYVCVVCKCVRTVSFHMACYFMRVREHLWMCVCAEVGQWLWRAHVCLLDFGGFLSWVCACVYCQYINIQYRELQLCALFCTEMFVFVFRPAVFTFACSSLHIWRPTTWSNKILFHLSDMTCCLITGKALSVLCGPLLFHTTALLTDPPDKQTHWPPLPLCLSCPISSCRLSVFYCWQSSHKLVPTATGYVTMHVIWGTLCFPFLS